MAALGGLLLAAATPPAWFAGAEFLVVAGLAVWFAIATASPRPWLHTYLLGCVHMACFSWSVRHVMLPAYLAIVLLGGLYFVAGSMAVRALPKRWHGLGFAVAVGGSFWLRSVMPEIHYPHGQPCHCLWQWPGLLGAVAVGGEPLANALLGGLGAAVVTQWRSWRVGAPVWRSATVQSAAAVAASVLATVVGTHWNVVTIAARTVAIAAIEPGLHSLDPYEGLSHEEARRRFQELFEQRLLAPTRALLAESPPPELILWPESSVPGEWAMEEIEHRRRRVLGGKFVSTPGVRLLVGINAERDGRSSPAALLLASDGSQLGHQEKQCLVPGGEFLPLVHWLPASISGAIYDAFRAALGSAPDSEPGRFLPPLQTAGGVPFGALLCYDNAFPGPAAAQVAAGAQFLCVLSNETWYRGGAELTQLAAMTVCRALELRTPIVRCTTDGWSLAVDAWGRVTDHLPIRPSPAGEARILRTNLSIAPGLQRPMPWLAAVAGPLLAGLLGLALTHGMLAWARLRVARTAPTVPGDRGQPRSSGRTGS